MNVLAQAYRYYIDSFRGFGPQIWVLTALTFVNRAGSMVLPFLSLYLTKDMGLTLEQVGWIMAAYGAGSVLGSWAGGRLTDRIGFYDVMLASLITSGVAFIALRYVQGFLPFVAGIFVVSLLMDAYRPAMFVAIRAYARPENRTRAVTLIRLAINLGFSMGPAIGGLIIAYLGYGALFHVDGITCIAASGVLWLGLRRKQANQQDENNRSIAQRSPYSDRLYLLFLAVLVLIGIAFLQYFSTLPLFYSEVHGLSEKTIGILLGLNGLLIFLTEMPLIKYCENKRFKLFRILRFSTVLFALSFAVLNVLPIMAFLWIGMILMTVGEMLNFPLMNRFAFDRSDRGKPGAYMALFTIGWSVAHIVGHPLGLNLVARLGYEKTWWILTGVLMLGWAMLYWLEGMLSREEVIGSAKTRSPHSDRIGTG